MIEVTKPGNYGGRYISELILKEMADVYDPKLHEVPLVIGIPKHDDPAYGRIKSLKFVNGALFAEPSWVDPKFMSLLDSGARISGSFYLPDAASNPVPGKYYLRDIKLMRERDTFSKSSQISFSCPPEEQPQTNHVIPWNITRYV
jgi:hypothetical protein